MGTDPAAEFSVKPHSNILPEVGVSQHFTDSG
jgi:hypothetical protein